MRDGCGGCGGGRVGDVRTRHQHAALHARVAARGARGRLLQLRAPLHLHWCVHLCARVCTCVRMRESCRVRETVYQEVSMGKGGIAGWTDGERGEGRERVEVKSRCARLVLLVLLLLLVIRRGRPDAHLAIAFPPPPRAPSSPPGRRRVHRSTASSDARARGGGGGGPGWVGSALGVGGFGRRKLREGPDHV